MIYCLIKPQADKLGVTDEQFGQSLGGDAVLAAQTAFYEELVDFFQKRGRADRVKAISAQQKMIALAIKKVEADLANLDLTKQIEKIFSSSSTNLPQ